jgi:pimeloyl-ACP methyl ester carboxylesterase
MAPASGKIGDILRAQQADMLIRWVEAYRASPLRMPRPVDPQMVARLVSPILECLADALGPWPSPGRGGTEPPAGAAQSPASALVPGSTLAREVEKAAALVGALHANGDASGFDVAALFYALRDLFAALWAVDEQERAALVRFAEWLSAVACDSFAAARVQAERERWREQLEDGTPVVLAAPELPVAFLVGRPDGVLLDSVLSRLLLLVVRVGARAAVIDAAGMGDPARREVLEALGRFLAHRKISGSVSLVAVGLADDPEQAWRELAERSRTDLTFEAYFDRALARALSVAGYRLVKT